MFHHTICHSLLRIDLSKQIKFVATSVAINPFGFNFGAVEVTGTSLSSSSGLGFECPKCGSLEKKENEVCCQCLVCLKNKPLKEIFTSMEIPYICQDCLKQLTSPDVRKDSEEIKQMREFLSIPDEINFKSILDILNLKK